MNTHQLQKRISRFKLKPIIFTSKILNSVNSEYESINKEDHQKKKKKETQKFKRAKQLKLVVTDIRRRKINSHTNVCTKKKSKRPFSQCR